MASRLHQRRESESKGTVARRVGYPMEDSIQMHSRFCTGAVRRAVWMTCAVALLGLTGACAGTATIDGYDGEYVEAAPPGIEVYPRYPFRDGYVYDVHGRWYHQHGGRWVVYARSPREVAHEHYHH